MRQSNEDEFTDFVCAHSTSLFRTAFVITGDYQRAEDVLQMTLVRLHQRWPGWRSWTARCPTREGSW